MKKKLLCGILTILCTLSFAVGGMLVSAQEKHYVATENLTVEEVSDNSFIASTQLQQDASAAIYYDKPIMVANGLSFDFVYTGEYANLHEQVQFAIALNDLVDGTGNPAISRLHFGNTPESAVDGMQFHFFANGGWGNQYYMSFQSGNDASADNGQYTWTPPGFSQKLIDSGRGSGTMVTTANLMAQKRSIHFEITSDAENYIWNIIPYEADGQTYVAEEYRAQVKFPKSAVSVGGGDFAHNPYLGVFVQTYSAPAGTYTVAWEIRNITNTSAFTEFSFTQSDVKLAPGESLDAATLLKVETSNPDVSKEITWTEEENDGVISLEGSKITALKAGTAKVKATNVEGASVYLNVKVSSVTKFELDKESLTLFLDESEKIGVTLEGGTSYTFRSENDAVATVDTEGNVTGAAAGTTRIIVTNNEGDSLYCEVKVLNYRFTDQTDPDSFIVSSNATVAELENGWYIKNVSDSTKGIGRFVINQELSPKKEVSFDYQMLMPYSSFVLDQMYYTICFNELVAKDGSIDMERVNFDELGSSINGVQFRYNADSSWTWDGGTVKANVYANGQLAVMNDVSTPQWGGAEFSGVKNALFNGEKVNFRFAAEESGCVLTMTPYDANGALLTEKSYTVNIPAKNFSFGEGVYICFATAVQNSETREMSYVVSNFRSGKIASTTLDKQSVTLSPTETNVKNPVKVSSSFYEGVEEFPVSYVWSSSNENVITVDSETGDITVVAPGNAYLIVTDSEGNQAKCEISIDVDSLTVAKTSDTVVVSEGNNTYTIEYSVQPSNAVVTLISSDESIAVCNGNVVTFVGAGRVTITVQAGLKSENVVLTVEPDAFTLNKTELTLEKYETFTLTVDSLLSNYTFVSSNEQVATVDANGKVTAVGEGEATITVTLGTVEKTCVVTVLPFETEDPDANNGGQGGDEENPTEKGGCGSSLAGISVILSVTLLTVGCLGLKKKS